jgi:CheY-like chemotaxis protein
MSDTTKDLLSVLLLDDNPDLVALYKEQLEELGPFKVTTETDSQRAKNLADRQLFDVVVIDAKLDYRGVEFGGLRLADDLRLRYGNHSLLIISRFITAELMKVHGACFDFVEKSSGEGTQFCGNLAKRLQKMRQRQYVFVAMPFADQLRDLYRNHIKTGVTGAGYQCVRVDEVSHNRPIQDVIFEMVEKSKLVVFVADGASANAYYEAGFADAMRKEVVIVAKTQAELKFDVANRHTLTYDGNLETLTFRLCEKICALRLTSPWMV